VLAAAHRLHDEEGITIILIAHYMEEVIGADHIFVMDRGKVAMQGTPREIFAQVEQLQALGLTVPQVTLLGHMLREQGLELPEAVLTADELAEKLGAIYEHSH